MQLEHFISGLDEALVEGGVAEDCSEVEDLIFFKAGFFFLTEEFLRELGLTMDGDGFLLSRGLLATLILVFMLAFALAFVFLLLLLLLLLLVLL